MADVPNTIKNKTHQKLLTIG